MPIEMLTYAALGTHLKISAEAARALARRLRLTRSRSDIGKTLVSVDLAEVRHRPRPPVSGHAVALLTAQIEALQLELARLETSVAGHRADFERERDRADRLSAELLQTTSEMMAAKEQTARLEASLQTGGGFGGAIDGDGLARRRLGNLAAELVRADRKACG